MEYICMICGRKKHVLREGKVMLCTRCITALGLALGEKLGEPAVGPDPSPRQEPPRAAVALRNTPAGVACPPPASRRGREFSVIPSLSRDLKAGLL